MTRYVVRKSLAAAHLFAWSWLAAAFVAAYILCGLSGAACAVPDAILGWMQYNEQQAWHHWEG